MPYDYKKNQDCRQADDSKGTYVTKKTGAKKQKCWKSQAAFDRARIARHAKEADVDEAEGLDALTETIIERILETLDGNDN